MTKHLAWVFGIVFILVGILGFVPGITTSDQMLFGIFMIDPLHNAIHLLSGIAAIGAALSAGLYARLYFRVFGVVYGVVTLLGFLMGSVAGLIVVNMADNILHLVIAAAALYIGFVMKETPMEMGMNPSNPQAM